MLVFNGLLYICDVNQLVVYNLEDLTSEVIVFPEGELFLNDIITDGEEIYVKVTNTGNIYRFNQEDTTLVLWYNIVVDGHSIVAFLTTYHQA